MKGVQTPLKLSLKSVLKRMESHSLQRINYLKHSANIAINIMSQFHTQNVPSERELKKYMLKALNPLTAKLVEYGKELNYLLTQLT